ncbi:MAG: hypothetical protein ACI31C_01210 [Muribaculaceae bacterium]
MENINNQPIDDAVNDSTLQSSSTSHQALFCPTDDSAPDVPADDDDDDDFPFSFLDLSIWD